MKLSLPQKIDAFVSFIPRWMLMYIFAGFFFPYFTDNSNTVTTKWWNFVTDLNERWIWFEFFSPKSSLESRGMFPCPAATGKLVWSWTQSSISQIITNGYKVSLLWPETNQQRD
jgi:hypothetical protein